MVPKASTKGSPNNDKPPVNSGARVAGSSKVARQPSMKKQGSIRGAPPPKVAKAPSMRGSMTKQASMSGEYGDMTAYFGRGKK